MECYKKLVQGEWFRSVQGELHGPHCTGKQKNIELCAIKILAVERPSIDHPHDGKRGNPGHAVMAEGKWAEQRTSNLWQATLLLDSSYQMSGPDNPILVPQMSDKQWDSRVLQLPVMELIKQTGQGSTGQNDEGSDSMTAWTIATDLSA